VPNHGALARPDGGFGKIRITAQISNQTRAEPR